MFMVMTNLLERVFFRWSDDSALHGSEWIAMKMLSSANY